MLLKTDSAEIVTIDFGITFEAVELSIASPHAYVMKRSLLQS